MAKLHWISFVGRPSSLATAQTVSTGSFSVVLSVSGPDSATISPQIKTKLQHTEVDSPTSFLSLIERVQELWSGSYGEQAALFTFENKMYLLVKNGEIWLRRGEKFGRVLKSSDEMKVVEGRVQDQDTYLVMTQSASVAVTQVLTQIAEGKLNFKDGTSRLQSYIDSSGLSDRSAVSIVDVSDTEVAAVPTILSDGTVAPAPPPPAARAAQIGEKLQTAKVLLKKVVVLARGGIKQIPPAIAKLRQLRNSQMTKEQKRKIILFLIAISAVTLLIFGFFGFRAMQIRQGQTFLIPFQTKLAVLQQTANTDVVSARDQVLVLQKEFETQRSTLNTNLFIKSELADFSTQLDNFVKDVSGKVELQTLPIFYDFRLVQADYIAARGDTDANTAVFLDLGKQSALAVKMDTKQQTILPIGQYTNLKDLSFDEDQLYLLADGVYKFPIDSQEAAKKIIPEGDSNRDGEFVRVFGEFVYVFNAEKRNLYRYSVGSSSGSESSEEAPQPIGWFQDKKDLDFPSVTSFAIDGSVWLGTQQGQILRYERGNPVAFNVQGLQEPFSSSLKIYTKEDLDSIFVLESAKNRVVRLNKEGVFVRQIESPSLGAATDIIFSATTNKAYAVAGSLVYELAL